MIDLNHLLNNLELYKQKYTLKGLKTNLDVFVKLEKQRKELQLKTEGMRALCNKLCAQVTTFREKNKDTNELIEQITSLDEQINKNNNQLAKFNKTINKKLSKLHNLPEFENQFNLQLSTTKTNVTLKDLFNFINEKYDVTNYDKNILCYFKQSKNMVLTENSLPCVTKCKDGFLFLCKESDIEKIKNVFLDYFRENALSLIQVNCKKLNKANAASFYVHLNKKESFYFEINKEYFSRLYSYKYRNSKIDMTKFVNQINILLKW